ncbi:MAG TPA: class E sortase [Acidimicrobiales bacterium]|nr:class E sortase [Acidimicrobiales bacterium]
MTERDTWVPADMAVSTPLLLPPAPPRDVGMPVQTDTVGAWPPATPRHRRRSRGMRWDAVGVVLTGMGALLLLFFTYLYVFTPLTHGRDQHRLLQSLVGNRRAVYSLVAHQLPAEGKPIGILTIPALHQREVIVMGTSSADLQQGPGLMAHTVVPGDPGNSVIAGRRATYGAPFASLGTLVRGDRVDVVDGAGRFTFRVTSVRQLSGGQADAAPVRGQAWLTLVTSNSALDASGHLIVVAKAAVSSDVTGSLPRSRYDTTLAGLGGDPAAGILALLWGVAFVVGLGAALYAIRRSRQVWLPYMFATPVLLACGLFACESLARCLPATL